MPSAVPDSVTLVDSGKPRFCLQLQPPQSGQALLAPMEALIEHLEACLKAPIPWYERRAAASPPVRLVLHLDVLSDLGPQEFEVSSAPDEVVIRAGTVMGVDFGVHHFLETFFSVRWLWPGPTGTVTPKATSITIPLGKSRHSPDYHWRQLWVGGSFWREDDCSLAERKFGHVSAQTIDELAKWQRRRRLGGLKIADGHRWAEICSPLVYGDSHPEYFALVKGKRDVVYSDGKHGNHPCTTNPDVVQLTAKYIKAQFKRQPDLDGFSIATNDGLGFCQCENCLAVDREVSAGSHDTGVIDAVTHEQPGKLPADHASITDRMLRFANEIAVEVAREYPTKLLLTLIYSVYRNPPRKTRLHPNVIAQFCSMGHTHTEPAVFDAEMGIFKKLSGFADRLGVYDYIVNGANGTLPRGTARHLGHSIQQYHTLGARYYASQSGLDFGTAGFNYYFVSQALWDVNSSAPQVLADYCRVGFGPAAGPVESYLKAFHDRWDQCWPNVKPEQRKMELLVSILYPPAWLAQRRAELAAARAMAGSEPQIAARIEFLAQALAFLEQLQIACAAGIASMASPQDTSLQSDFAQKRDTLLAWVDQHRNGFWISAMWFDYQRLVRSGILSAAQTPSTQTKSH